MPNNQIPYIKRKGNKQISPQTILKRLRKTFGGDSPLTISQSRTKVKDTGSRQSYSNINNTRGSLYSTGRNISGYSYHQNNLNPYSTGNSSLGYVGNAYFKNELYYDYELMDSDSIISSALDIYSDECTTKNEKGEILDISSDNNEILVILENLFYEILNINFNLWPWIRNVVKYGNYYLKLQLSTEGIVGIEPLSLYATERVEEIDSTQQENFEIQVYFRSSGMQGTEKNNLLGNYEVVHFRMLGDVNYLPYGKSLIEAARKEWKRLVLIEDAMLIHRIMRAPDKRVFYVNVGNLDPNLVDTYMDNVMDRMKKVPFIDERSGDYNLRYNMQNITEDFYIPTRGDLPATKIEPLGGLEYASIEDIQYIKNKMIAALKIPKAHLGYEEGLEGKSTLASQDIRFSKTIERIQQMILNELNKIAMIHLYILGYRGDDLINYELTLNNPSTVQKREKLALLSETVDLASNIKNNKLFSNEWIYKNLFDSNRQEYIANIKALIKDSEIEALLNPMPSPDGSNKKDNKDLNKAIDQSLYDLGQTELQKQDNNIKNTKNKKQPYKNSQIRHEFDKGSPLALSDSEEFSKRKLRILESLKPPKSIRNKKKLVDLLEHYDKINENILTRLYENLK